MHHGAPWEREDDDHDDTTQDREARLQELKTQMLQYGMELKAEFANDGRREVRRALEDTFALVAYENVGLSSLAPLLDVGGRGPVAEELNGAILGMISPTFPCYLLFPSTMTNPHHLTVPDMDESWRHDLV